MKATIVSFKKLKDVYSVSGMEIIGDSIYVCCDDSKFLVELSKSGEVLHKYTLFNVVEERIAKSEKADFEAMFEHNNKLYLLGSGSSEKRNLMCCFDLQNKQSSFYSISHIYAQLREYANLKMEDFNIEGAAVYNDYLLLLNRGDNSIFQISLSDFVATNRSNIIKRFCFELPMIDDCISGFSAAMVLNDNLYFSASVEKTNDWINDGEILGSFIGKINLCRLDEKEITSVLVQGKLKIEAISYDENCEHFIALTDNDGHESEMLELKINF